MLIAIVLTAVVLTAIGLAQSDARGRSIRSHPYNNRYSDASGAREDHLG